MLPSDWLPNNRALSLGDPFGFYSKTFDYSSILRLVCIESSPYPSKDLGFFLFLHYYPYTDNNNKNFLVFLIEGIPIPFTIGLRITACLLNM